MFSENNSKSFEKKNQSLRNKSKSKSEHEKKTFFSKTMLKIIKWRQVKIINNFKIWQKLFSTILSCYIFLFSKSHWRETNICFQTGKYILSFSDPRAGKKILADEKPKKSFFSCW